MSTSRKRLAEIRSHLDKPTTWWRFSPALEVEFRRRAGESYLPVARSAFLAVIALVAIAMVADQWVLEARLDMPIVIAMFAIEFPMMVGLYWFVGRLPSDKVPTLMTAVMVIQAVIFIWVTLRLADPSDEVPYLYEILVLYQYFLFFFTGVMFVPALVLGVIVITASVGGYVLIGVDGPSVARVALFLVATAGIGIVVRYLAERILREDFLIRILSEEASRTDPLTGLLNRRGFQVGLDRLLRQARRDRRPVGLLMIDLDNFKQVNDRLGHARGDTLLEQVACVLESVGRRPLDLISRSGGDEFVVALYDAPEPSVPAIAEKLKSALSHSFGEWKATVPELGASVGAAWFAPGDAPANSGAMLEVLDRALYAAKRAGKDQVNYQRTGVWDNADLLSAEPMSPAAE